MAAGGPPDMSRWASIPEVDSDEVQPTCGEQVVVVFVIARTPWHVGRLNLRPLKVTGHYKSFAHSSRITCTLPLT